MNAAATGLSQQVPSPIGTLTLVADDTHLREIHFPKERHPTKRPSPPTGDNTVLRAVREQLEADFAGRLRHFDLPLRPAGTDFQREVWAMLARIPHGQTWSYGELARRIGKPDAVRAVGAANGRNPIPIVLPCHRVIGADGALTGFGGGLPAKRFLLQLEGVLPAEADLFAGS
ncbi:MAG: methylated-DNA--[protein]-cysteine S-methyltransferase [Pseudoxanthomonas sp.]